MRINADTRFTRFFLFFRVYLFFFWISIYIEKKGMMKISRNRVTGFFVGVLFTAFTEVFVGGFWWRFLGSFCQP